MTDDLDEARRLEDARIDELIVEYGGYDPGLKLGEIYGTCKVGEFIALLHTATRLEAAEARVRELTEALRFYRDNWQGNADGDLQEPHLTRCWVEPTTELFDDAGKIARAALGDGA